MIAWLRREQLPEGKPQYVLHPPGHLVVVRLGERVFALDHFCCHAGASLLGGQVQGCAITCRAHGYRFDLATGELLEPAGEPLRQRTWRVEERDGGWAILEEPRAG